MRRPNALITDDYEPPPPFPTKTYIYRSSEGDFLIRHGISIHLEFVIRLLMYFLKIVVMDSLFTSP